MVELFDLKISHFENTLSTECVKEQLTILDFLKRIKGGFYKESIAKVRNGNSWVKKNELNTIAFHGVFDNFRKKDLFIESSGLIILDVDNISKKDLKAVKREIFESSDSVFCVMVSPSGNGLKILYFVDSELVNQNNYNQIGKKVQEKFSEHGKIDYLSVTDTLIATYDSEILIRKNPIADHIYIEEYESENDVELEKRDENIDLWEDVEEFFSTVLHDSIVDRTNNNYHYIQVSLFELAKFGFYAKNEDLSFVIDFAENEFGTNSENQKRYLSASNIANGMAQTKWAYDTRFNEGNDEKTDFEMKDSENEEGGNGLEDYYVDYSNLYDETLKIAKMGNRVGYEVSYKNLADILRFYGSGIFTWTGIPTHGKTEFVDAVTLDLARLYGHVTLVAGFEQSVEEHVLKLMRRLEGKDIRCESYLNNSENEDRLKKLYDFIVSKIIHLNVNKTGGNINKILEAFKYKITSLREKGLDVRYVVIDPFNMVSIKGNYGDTQKIEEILRRITQFSHEMNVLVHLVAHPTKMKKDEKTGKFEVPNFYNVKGSSAFFEMSYHGAVVYRDDFVTMVKVLKVKQNSLGEKDECAYFLYHKESGRHIPCTEDGDELKGSHRDVWLK